MKPLKPGVAQPVPYTFIVVKRIGFSVDDSDNELQYLTVPAAGGLWSNTRYKNGNEYACLTPTGTLTAPTLDYVTDDFLNSNYTAQSSATIYIDNIQFTQKTYVGYRNEISHDLLVSGNGSTASENLIIGNNLNIAGAPFTGTTAESVKDCRGYQVVSYMVYMKGTITRSSVAGNPNKHKLTVKLLKPSQIKGSCVKSQKCLRPQDSLNSLSRPDTDEIPDVAGGYYPGKVPLSVPKSVGKTLNFEYQSKNVTESIIEINPCNPVSCVKKWKKVRFPFEATFEYLIDSSATGPTYDPDTSACATVALVSAGNATSGSASGDGATVTAPQSPNTQEPTTTASGYNPTSNELSGMGSDLCYAFGLDIEGTQQADFAPFYAVQNYLNSVLDCNNY